MMERTQIYLTQEQSQAVEAIAARRGQTKSEVIRAAINRFLADNLPSDRRALMRQAAGIWADRDDLPQFFEELRQEWDRESLDEPVEPVSTGQ
jgi:hypothetical protein